MSKIVFVCSGNTWRSPMAAGIFNSLAKADGGGHSALSCGLAAYIPLPASQNAVAAAAEYGADISGHISRQLSPELLAGATAIYCTTPAHAARLKALYPEYGAIISLMPCGEVQDPYGGSLAEYMETAAKIYRGVLEIIRGLS